MLNYEISKDTQVTLDPETNTATLVFQQGDEDKVITLEENHNYQIEMSWYIRNLKDQVLVTGLVRDEDMVLKGQCIILPKQNFNIDQVRFQLDKYYRDRHELTVREDGVISILCDLSVMQPIVEFLFGLEPIGMD